MAKPRKSWEPKYHFGGSQFWGFTPPPLGESQSPYFVKLKAAKPRKAKKK